VSDFDCHVSHFSGAPIRQPSGDDDGDYDMDYDDLRDYNDQSVVPSSSDDRVPSVLLHNLRVQECDTARSRIQGKGC
jgi:hypothetical protein